MIGFGLALAGVAAAIHAYIFVMESLTWTSARTRATFGTSPEEAAATREMAFNQGFYNLFLAVLVVLGIVLYAADRQDVGLTLVVAGAGSMVAAGLVLILSSPSKARAALVQLVPPALGVLGVVLGLTL
ncbi:transmembrane protein [Mycobacteroides abscessus]|nr:transmembrane protein [Mycobacteroides abscessus]